MGKDAVFEKLVRGLARVAVRIGLPPPADPVRLTGGAMMESWRFRAGEDDYVLRRAPSAAFIADRPFDHASESALIAAAHADGITAPEVVAVLNDGDNLGSGFVMRALPGTADPRAILQMATPDALLADCARNLARIHALPASAVPAGIPVLDAQEGIAALRAQFEEAGGDRPIIALGLRWLMDNVPPPVAPVLNHGDFRLGNILAENGRLTGVLDWELAHWSDHHEDLAFGCMAVWRFARYDRPALGLGSLDDWFAAYEAAGGAPVDPARFRFWTIYRTVWWALGCLRQAQVWREGQDRALERVVISRRTSEQELDLLLLLEEEAPEKVRTRRIDSVGFLTPENGEADTAEMATAVSEWLTTIKHRIDGHDRFQYAIARNALGIIARADHGLNVLGFDPDEPPQILAGTLTIRKRHYLDVLRRAALRKCQIDSPKYPALTVARERWLAKE